MFTKCDILNILIRAKDIYYKLPNFTGMCYCIRDATNELYSEWPLNYWDIKKIIPEFNPQFLNAPVRIINGYWWNVHNKEARIYAFDKLINHYKQLIENEKDNIKISN